MLEVEESEFIPSHEKYVKIMSTNLVRIDVSIDVSFNGNVCEKLKRGNNDSFDCFKR
jgi:hypothetical protein